MEKVLHGLAKRMSGGECDAWSFNWTQLRYQHLNMLKAKLLEENSFKTVNVKLSAVRGVIRAAFRCEMLDGETKNRTLDISRATGQTLPKGRSASPFELQSLFAVCALDRAIKPATAARDAALLSVLYSPAAPRRAEVIGMDFEDYNRETGELKIRFAKGNKERMNYLGEDAMEALEDWFTLRGEMPGPLFAPDNKGGKIVYTADGTPQRMIPHAIWKMMARRTAQAKIKSLTPHDLRRTATGDLIDKGLDLSTMQSLLGHASPVTTVAYDRRPEERKRRAAKMLHVPYIRG
jgi:site-specific recombinase XerD